MGGGSWTRNKRINDAVATRAALRPSPSAVKGKNISQVTEAPVSTSRTSIPDPDFNVADYYERTKARADKAITPEAARKVLTSHDPNRGELMGTSPRGYLLDQQVGDPFIETIRSKQIPLTKKLDTPFELDYDYGYHC